MRSPILLLSFHFLDGIVCSTKFLGFSFKILVIYLRDHRGRGQGEADALLRTNAGLDLRVMTQAEVRRLTN